MSDLPDPWSAYARLQEKLRRTHHVDGSSWGLEAALNEILAGASSGPEDIDRIVRSEARKERHRTTLRRIYLPVEDSTGNPAPENAFDARRLLRRIRMQVTGAQWSLLRAIGEGHEYKDIAAVANVAAGALRARVLRLRRMLVIAL